MRVLVAGGTGFLGRAVLAELAASHHRTDLEVLVLSRHGDRDGGSEPTDGRVVHLAGEWSDASADRRILDIAPDVVVNLIGDSHPRSSVGRESAEVRSQLLPFLELIDALEPRGLRRVVFASSAGSIYRSGREAVAKPQADTAYHSTKRSVEHYLSSRSRASGLAAVSLRISNPIGDLDRPGFGLVGHLARSVAAGQDVDFFGDYDVPKDYVAVEDVAAAILASALEPGVGAGHTIADVGSGWAIDAPGMDKVVRSLAEAGLDPTQSPLDYGFAPSSLDLQPLRRLTGWQPRRDPIAAIDRILRLHSPGGSG